MKGVRKQVSIHSISCISSGGSFPDNIRGMGGGGEHATTHNGGIIGIILFLVGTLHGQMGLETHSISQRHPRSWSRQYGKFQAAGV